MLSPFLALLRDHIGSLAAIALLQLPRVKMFVECLPCLLVSKTLDHGVGRTMDE